MGKTTVARHLATCHSALHLRIDSIEAALLASGRLGSEVGDAGYRVGYAVAADHLANGLDVIADSVNPVKITRDAWREVGRRLGATVVDVDLFCSDPTVHRWRIETRMPDLPGQILPVWADVLGRKFEAHEGSDLRVDTAKLKVEEIAALIWQKVMIGRPCT